MFRVAINQERGLIGAVLRLLNFEYFPYTRTSLSLLLFKKQDMRKLS